MALIPIEERVEPTTHVSDVPGYNGAPRQLAYPVDCIVKDIQKAARDAGFTDPNLFTIFSGYRSDASQERLFIKRVNQILARDPSLSTQEAQRLARKTVAPPGRSSHRTGYAFDMYFGHKSGYSVSSSDPENVTHIESTPAYAFMQNLAPKYRLTQLPNEPWHWECDSECRSAYTATPAQKQAAKWIAGITILGCVTIGAWLLHKSNRIST